MPKMKVCGRAWALGTDDFVAPSALSIYFRLLSLGVIVAIIVLLHNKLLKCDQPYFYVSLYLYGTLSIIVAILLVDIVLFHLSSKGAIMNERPRRHVPAFFVARCFLAGVEVCWTGFGTFVAVYKFPCDLTTHVILSSWVMFSWISFFLFMIGLLLIFDPLGSTPCDGEDYSVHAGRIWKMRIQLIKMLMCSYQSYEEFEDVARILQEEFRHNELVMSDITAGLILLSRKQSRKSALFFEEAHKFALEEQLSHETAEKVIYFFKFATAAYGWPNYVVENKAHILEVCCTLDCDQTLYSNLISREGESCCYYNTKTVVKKTGINKEDLILISFTNSIHEVPFYICVDHNSENIVIAIRGTQSLADAITDMLIQPVSIQWGYPPSFKAHKGMLTAANYVYSKMQRIRALDYALEHWSNYQIIVCGHSLGAGVACLVTFILRQQEFLKDKNITCYSYGPPGMLLSVEAANYSTQFVFSGVLEGDIIPRISVGAVRKFEQDLIEVLFECRENKSKVLFGTMARILGALLPCCRCWVAKRSRSRHNSSLSESNGQFSRDTSPTHSRVLSHQSHKGDIEKDLAVGNSKKRSGKPVEAQKGQIKDGSRKSSLTTSCSETLSLVSGSVKDKQMEMTASDKKNFEDNPREFYIPKPSIDNLPFGITTPLYPCGVFLYFEPYLPNPSTIRLHDHKGRKLPKTPHFIDYVKNLKEFRYFWVKRSFFNRIFITERMFSSHFPFSMDYAMVVGRPREDVYPTSLNVVGVGNEALSSSVCVAPGAVLTHNSSSESVAVEIKKGTTFEQSFSSEEKSSHAIDHRDDVSTRKKNSKKQKNTSMQKSDEIVGDVSKDDSKVSSLSQGIGIQLSSCVLPCEGSNIADTASVKIEMMPNEAADGVTGSAQTTKSTLQQDSSLSSSSCRLIATNPDEGANVDTGSMLSSRRTSSASQDGHRKKRRKSSGTVTASSANNTD